MAATSRHMANASSSLPRTIPSITFTSIAPGMESFPTPSISQLLKPTSSAGTPLTMWSQTPSRGDPPSTRISGFCDLRYRPVPLTVPPVLPPAMKCVTAPEVWCQISGRRDLVRFRVVGLLYWSALRSTSPGSRRGGSRCSGSGPGGRERRPRAACTSPPYAFIASIFSLASSCW